MIQLKKLYFALSLFILSVIIGLIGFIQIEGMGWIDSFYMAIITIGSVGFTEVHELSQAGRLFTAIYIIFNLGVYAYTIAVLGQYLFQGELKNIFSKIHTEKKLKKMVNHTIVCGLGRNGSKAVEELIKNGFSVVGIEKAGCDYNKFDNKNLTYFEGDATQDEILIKAGIKNASAIITTLPNDADNVFITLTARELNPKIKIISRASAPHSENKLRRSGADHVVMPEVIGGHHMASLVWRKQSSNLNYNYQEDLSFEYEIQEIPVSTLLKHSQGKILTDLKLQLAKNQLILGYKKFNGDNIFNPDENIALNENDIVIILKCIGKRSN